MSHYFPLPVVIAYCIFAIFSAQDQFCVKEFRGRLEFYRMLLGTFGFFMMLVGIAFVIYFGWRTTWWAALVLFLLGVLVYIPFTFCIESITERFIHLQAWGLASFIVMPVCAFIWFRYTP